MACVRTCQQIQAPSTRMGAYEVGMLLLLLMLMLLLLLPNCSFS
jgi:hypothetical protein